MQHPAWLPLRLADPAYASSLPLPLARPACSYGYGLPISRLYARYFGGDLSIISMEGYGTGARRAVTKLDYYVVMPCDVPQAASAPACPPDCLPGCLPLPRPAGCPCLGHPGTATRLPCPSALPGVLVLPSFLHSQRPGPTPLHTQLVCRRVPPSQPARQRAGAPAMSAAALRSSRRRRGALPPRQARGGLRMRPAVLNGWPARLSPLPHPHPGGRIAPVGAVSIPHKSPGRAPVPPHPLLNKPGPPP